MGVLLCKLSASIIDYVIIETKLGCLTSMIVTKFRKRCVDLVIQGLLRNKSDILDSQGIAFPSTLGTYRFVNRLCKFYQKQLF